MNEKPDLRILSLGAGVQSTALLIMAARGDIAPIDYAIFANPGWEGRRTYAHLDRLEREIARPAGIPIRRVSVGNVRDDALNPAHRFASMPLFIKNPDGSQGKARRQCTAEYKIRPIKEEVRRLLGAKPKKNGRPGSVPRGRWAEQLIGYSTDELDRAYDDKGNLKTGDVLYSRNSFPLLDLDMSRDHCQSLLDSYGFGDTPKSACIGCPFHTNPHWRLIREDPADWADAVDFDRSIRAGSARATDAGHQLRGEAYLHRSLLPLDVAPIDRDSFHVWAGRQGDVLQMLSIAEYEERLTAEQRDGLTGCSPYGC